MNNALPSLTNFYMNDIYVAREQTTPDELHWIKASWLLLSPSDDQTWYRLEHRLDPFTSLRLQTTRGDHQHIVPAHADLRLIDLPFYPLKSANQMRTPANPSIVTQQTHSTNNRYLSHPPALPNPKHPLVHDFRPQHPNFHIMWYPISSTQRADSFYPSPPPRNDNPTPIPLVVPPPALP